MTDPALIETIKQARNLQRAASEDIKTAQWHAKQSEDLLDTVLKKLNDCQIPPQPSPTQQTSSGINNPDLPASDAQYRMMFAIWHNELQEKPELKPQKGMTKSEAHAWINQHQSKEFLK